MQGSVRVLVSPVATSAIVRVRDDVEPVEFSVWCCELASEQLGVVT